MQLAEHIPYKINWTIRRYVNDQAFARNDPYEVSEIRGNVLLNAGITEALKLIGGISPTNNAFNNAAARIGVGDDNTAASAAQTGLIAATNKAYAGQESGFPAVAGQTITYRSVFGSGVANYAWEEFVIDDGAGTPIALNRRVSSQGTKASGQTWTIDVAITLG